MSIPLLQTYQVSGEKETCTQGLPLKRPCNYDCLAEIEKILEFQGEIIPLMVLIAP